MAGAGERHFEFRVLGAVDVVSGEQILEIGSTKQRALLALLVSKLNRPVSLDMIGEEVWAGNPPASLASTVQSLVYRIRKVLTDADAEAAGVVLKGRGSGYVLVGEADQVDASRFEQLADEARKYADTGAVDAAVTTFQHALALWRGPALADVADLSFARQVVGFAGEGDDRSVVGQGRLP